MQHHRRRACRSGFPIDASFLGDRASTAGVPHVDGVRFRTHGTPSVAPSSYAGNGQPFFEVDTTCTNNTPLVRASVSCPFGESTGRWVGERRIQASPSPVVASPTRGKVGAIRHVYPIGNGDVVTLRTDRSDPTSYHRRFTGSRSQVGVGSLAQLPQLAGRFC